MSKTNVTPTRAARIVFASALYDLVVTAPFATPWTATNALEHLDRIHHALNLGGSLPEHTQPLALLFANLMGSLVVVWSIVRLKMPTAELGAADTAARALFSLWFAFAMVHGVSRVLVGFLVLEVSWAFVQGAAVFPVLRARRLARIDA